MKTATKAPVPENRWNFGLIDVRYDGVFHDDFAPFVVTCALQVTRKCSRLTFTMQVTHSSGKPKRIKPKTEARGFLRSPCAVACTLDLVGDKWSLLVVRDLLRGNVTYGELQNSPEGIPTNILADRLKRLEEARLIAKSAYQEHPVRYAYELTEKGKALSEVLLAFVRWGKKHIPGTRTLESPAPHSVRGRKPARIQDRKS